MNFIEKIINFGTFDDRDYFDKAKTRTLNILALLSLSIISVYLVVQVFYKNWVGFSVDLLVVSTALLILFFHKRHQHRNAYFTVGIGFLPCLCHHCRYNRP